MPWREYHNATKHTPESLRRNRHGLDWANMPDPFRHYEGVPVLDLPADPPFPSIETLKLLNGARGESNANSGPEFLAQLLYYSAAISASKVAPGTGERYALRVNPSSGNLHPTEFHFCTRGLKDWPDGLYHYRPSSHMAEQRALGNFGEVFDDAAPVVFILTTIAWREAWKYQDRAYRYCLLDMGHAQQSLALAANALGCDVSFTGAFSHQDLASLCGFSGDEWPLMVLTLKGRGIPCVTSAAQARTAVAGAPNALSTKIIPYPWIDAVHRATSIGHIGQSIGRNSPSKATPAASRAFGLVARTRRSALDFVGRLRTMTRVDLRALLAAASPRAIDLYLYIHRVAEIEPGLYKYVSASGELELIRPGDQQVMAAALSLQQQLAGNACIAISMVARLEQLCAKHGPRGYRYAHFEAGAIGQRLYVAAEALGMQATGIGAFFDDQVHRYLALQPSDGDVVYHFAIGYAVRDTRVGAIA